MKQLLIIILAIYIACLFMFYVLDPVLKWSINNYRNETFLLLPIPFIFFGLCVITYGICIIGSGALIGKLHSKKRRKNDNRN